MKQKQLQIDEKLTKNTLHARLKQYVTTIKRRHKKYDPNQLEVEKKTKGEEKHLKSNSPNTNLLCGTPDVNFLQLR